MSHLKFHGIVTLGDTYRVSFPEVNGSVHIGGVDVVDVIEDAIDDKTLKSPVTVGLADETFDGELFAETGYGYSEYTPVDPDRLTVGPHNLIKVLERHEGKTVTMWVSDEPINLLDT